MAERNASLGQGVEKMVLLCTAREMFRYMEQSSFVIDRIAGTA